MKKISISLFVLLAGLGLSVSAQTLPDAGKGQVQQTAPHVQSQEATAAAKKFTAELNQLLTLDGNQQRQIFMTIVNIEEQYAEVKASTLSAEEKTAKMAALTAKRDSALERILTAAQFATYTSNKSATKSATNKE